MAIEQWFLSSRLTQIHHSANFQANLTITARRQMVVVSHHHQSCVLFSIEFKQQINYFFTRLRIKVPRWLIGK